MIIHCPSASFMSDFEKAMNVMTVRMLDTYYEDGAFYIVTYAKSTKVKAIEANEKVAFCYMAYQFDDDAHNIGHPLKLENAAIREKLMKVFEPWYFTHNDEDDESMCYVKVDLRSGFFYKDGTEYRVNFSDKTAETFPFTFDLVMPE